MWTLTNVREEAQVRSDALQARGFETADTWSSREWARR